MHDHFSLRLQTNYRPVQYYISVLLMWYDCRREPLPSPPPLFADLKVLLVQIKLVMWNVNQLLVLYTASKLQVKFVLAIVLFIQRLYNDNLYILILYTLERSNLRHEPKAKLLNFAGTLKANYTLLLYRLHYDYLKNKTFQHKKKKVIITNVLIR